MWLEHFRISKHRLLSQPVAPATRCARAWKEGWDTLKPHFCAWVLGGRAADIGPGEKAAADHCPRTPVQAARPPADGALRLGTLKETLLK